MIWSRDWKTLPFFWGEEATGPYNYWNPGGRCPKLTAVLQGEKGQEAPVCSIWCRISILQCSRVARHCESLPMLNDAPGWILAYDRHCSFLTLANSQTLQVNSQASELSSALSWPFVVSVLSVEKEGGQLSSSTNHGNHSILAGEGNSSQVKHDMFLRFHQILHGITISQGSKCLYGTYILNVYCIVIYSSVIHIHILYAFAGRSNHWLHPCLYLLCFH